MGQASLFASSAMTPPKRHSFTVDMSRMCLWHFSRPASMMAFLNGGAGLKLTWQRGNAWPDNPLDNPGRDNQNRNTSSTGNDRVLRSVDLI